MIFVVSSEYIPDVEVEADHFVMENRNATFHLKGKGDYYSDPIGFVANTYRIRVKEVANG